MLRWIRLDSSENNKRSAGREHMALCLLSRSGCVHKHADACNQLALSCLFFLLHNEAGLSN